MLWDSPLSCFSLPTLNSKFAVNRYYTHYLYLPIVNAVNEGTWGLALLLVFTGIIGADFWTNTTVLFANHYFMLLGFTGISAFTIFLHFKKIREKAEVKEIILRTRFSLAFIVVTMLIHLFNPSLYTYAFIYVMSFNVSKITIVCQLSHITGREFHPFRCSTFTLFVVLTWCLVSSFFTTSGDLLLHWGLLLMTLNEFGAFAYVVVNKLAELLSIKVFSVGPRTGSNNSIGGSSTRIGDPQSPQVNLESENFKKVANQNDSMPDDTQEGGI